MLTRPTIAIDADLTLLDSAMGPNGWLEWLECVGTIRQETFELFVEGQQLYYDLGLYFNMPQGYDAKDFWRGTSAYDMIAPVPGSQEAVAELSQWADIICVTALKGNHHKSKILRLKALFPQIKAFIGTKEKEYVRCDVLIDDRAVNFKKLPDHVLKIRIDTPFVQGYIDCLDTAVCKDWQQIVAVLNDKFGRK